MERFINNKYIKRMVEDNIIIEPKFWIGDKMSFKTDAEDIILNYASWQDVRENFYQKYKNKSNTILEKIYDSIGQRWWSSFYNEDELVGDKIHFLSDEVLELFKPNYEPKIIVEKNDYFNKYNTIIIIIDPNENDIRNKILKIIELAHKYGFFNSYLNTTVEDITDAYLSQYGNDNVKFYIRLAYKEGDEKDFGAGTIDTLHSLIEYGMIKYNKNYTLDDYNKLENIFKYGTEGPNYEPKIIVEGLKLYPYRFKTEKEFEDEFGDEWWEQLDWSWDEEMDFLFGTDYPFYVKEGDWLERISYDYCDGEDISVSWDMLIKKRNILPDYTSPSKSNRIVESFDNYKAIYNCITVSVTDNIINKYDKLIKIITLGQKYGFGLDSEENVEDWVKNRLRNFSTNWYFRFKFESNHIYMGSLYNLENNTRLGGYLYDKVYTLDDYNKLENIFKYGTEGPNYEPKTIVESVKLTEEQILSNLKSNEFNIVLVKVLGIQQCLHLQKILHSYTTKFKVVPRLTTSVYIWVFLKSYSISGFDQFSVADSNLSYVEDDRYHGFSANAIFYDELLDMADYNNVIKHFDNIMGVDRIMDAKKMYSPRTIVESVKYEYDMIYVYCNTLEENIITQKLLFLNGYKWKVLWYRNENTTIFAPDNIIFPIVIFINLKTKEISRFCKLDGESIGDFNRALEVHCEEFNSKYNLNLKHFNYNDPILKMLIKTGENRPHYRSRRFESFLNEDIRVYEYNIIVYRPDNEEDFNNIKEYFLEKDFEISIYYDINCYLFIYLLKKHIKTMTAINNQYVLNYIKDNNGINYYYNNSFDSVTYNIESFIYSNKSITTLKNIIEHGFKGPNYFSKANRIVESLNLDKQAIKSIFNSDKLFIIATYNKDISTIIEELLMNGLNYEWLGGQDSIIAIFYQGNNRTENQGIIFEISNDGMRFCENNTANINYYKGENIDIIDIVDENGFKKLKNALIEPDYSSNKDRIDPY